MENIRESLVRLTFPGGGGGGERLGYANEHNLAGPADLVEGSIGQKDEVSGVWIGRMSITSEETSQP
jgi:hypothetical protein